MIALRLRQLKMERGLTNSELAELTWDTGYREELRQLGFAERELLIEFGYPTQRFVFHAKHSETNNDK